MDIGDIIESIKADRMRITDHADEEIHNDDLTFEEVFVPVIGGEIIESYPLDKPYPSCLVYGKNSKKEPVHSVWAYDSVISASVLITAYKPDPRKWFEWKRRKK